MRRKSIVKRPLSSLSVSSLAGRLWMLICIVNLLNLLIICMETDSVVLLDFQMSLLKSKRSGGILSFRFGLLLLTISVSTNS